MTVIRDPELQFSEHVPIVIVGGGACGLTAALAAHERGAEAIVLERDERLWGSTGMSIGAVCAVGSAQQRAHGVEDSVERFVADVMAKTLGRADRELAYAIGRASGPMVDWLQERHDVPLLLDFAWRGLGHSQPRLHVPPARTGEQLITLLQSAVERAGVPILTQARVVAVVADAADRVRGVRIERPSGESEWLGCDALVLATCGFGANRAWIREHMPEIATARYFGHEGNMGDGIAWGRALGAGTADMTAYQGLGTLAEPQAIIVPHTLLIDGGVLVNTQGQRFTHELENISGMCVPVLAQPDGVAWVVFDARRLEVSLGHSMELRQLEELGAVKRAVSVAALAELLGIRSQSLAAELEAVAAARAVGGADRLGRRFDGCAPLAAPYCAIKVTGALFHTQGGLLVDSEARVLRADRSALPNLFAGGGAARSISGPDVTGYLPAVGLSMAMTLGQLAGAAAAGMTPRSSVLGK